MKFRLKSLKNENKNVSVFQMRPSNVFTLINSSARKAIVSKSELYPLSITILILFSSPSHWVHNSRGIIGSDAKSVWASLPVAFRQIALDLKRKLHGINLLFLQKTFLARPLPNISFICIYYNAQFLICKSYSSITIRANMYLFPIRYPQVCEELRYISQLNFHDWKLIIHSERKHTPACIPQG